MKFFDFINNAQIKAAKRISSAMNAQAQADSPSEQLEAERQQLSEFLQEDFFHVIRAAQAVGIGSADVKNIWAE